jgi:salicylate hydroxylase
MRIAVVGAGIAGLAMGLALDRAGLRYQIFEQATELREVGAGLQLAPNATRLLHRLGLAPALKETAVRPEFIELRRWDTGAPLGVTMLGDECEHLFGEPYYLVHRADLQRAMIGLLPDGRVRLAARCEGVRETADGVEARFAGAPAEVFDAVIGADGIHSAVRGSLARDEPRFMGRTVYRGLASAERVPLLRGEPRMLMWMGPGHHFLCYPVSGGRLVNFSASAPADDWRTESWLAEGNVADLARAYEAWDSEVLRVVYAAGRVTRWALHERDGHWGRGRITLIGDAGHASLPFLAQGANQAIEDAVVLAACLRAASPENVPGALRRYEECRRDRIARIQSIVRGRNVSIHLPDGDQQRQRDATLTNMLDLRSSAWLYGYDAEEAVAI